MEKRIILLIGYKGLIGSFLLKFFKKKKNTKLILIDKKDNIDLKDRDILKYFLNKNKNINYIINASGKNDHIIKENKRSVYEDENTLIEYIYENVIVPKNLIELSSDICKNLKSIINFSSLYGVKSPYHPMYFRKKSLSYCISKHGLEGLTKYYSTMLAKKNIRINNVRVGGVKKKQPQKFLKEFLKKTPADKLATKEDLANVVDFLCSDKSQYIYGNNISLDGGYTIW